MDLPKMFKVYGWVLICWDGWSYSPSVAEKSGEWQSSEYWGVKTNDVCHVMTSPYDIEKQQESSNGGAHGLMLIRCQIYFVSS